MEKEELLSRFSQIAGSFMFEINDKTTRENVIEAFKKLIQELHVEAERNGSLFYTLMRKFVDCTTPEQVDIGQIDIRVELIDGKIIEIEDYCDLVTNKERYITLLRWGIENFNFNLYL